MTYTHPVITVHPDRRLAWTMLDVGADGRLQVDVRSGENARFCVVLPAQGDTVLEVNVAEQASCDLVTLQEGGAGAVHATGTVAADGALRWRPVTIGGTVRHEIRSTCVGDRAMSEARWIVVARGGEYPKAIIRNVFEARNGAGEVAMRAVALAKGQALLDGRIEIGLGGGGTQTYLTQEALMLDASAKIDAIPGLEIKTNDVKASHSATVSRVNPEDIFYAGSRGIAPDAARRLLVEGFLGKLLDGIGDEGIREDLLIRVIAAAQ